MPRIEVAGLPMTAASGNLLTFMVSALNRAAEQKTDEEGE
jgi:hypothetical protein